jgi:hypothetical protein
VSALQSPPEASDFARFHCAHCEAKGWASDNNSATTAKRPSPDEIEKIKSDIAVREAEHELVRRLKALGLWRRGKPVPNTAVERYLRLARGYRASIPGTIRFLPASQGFAPAMIAAIGIADEIEPGILSIPDHAIRGVHITALLSDGSGKAGTDRDKIMIGKSIGSPIVLAPPDGLGLAITEGIEDALSVHEATGLGAWAAGSASRMPPLADVVPDYIECVTIVADADEVGKTNAKKLADALAQRSCETRLIVPSNFRRAA